MRKIFFAVIMAATLFVLVFPSTLLGNLQYLRENNLSQTNSLSHIVFSEVLYDSWVFNETEGEWLELYNPTNSALNIGGWSISDNNHTYTIPNGTTIGAFGFLVISAGSSEFISRYGCTPCLSNFSLQLNNSGDYLILKNSSGAVIDQVAWESGGSSGQIPGWGSSSSPYANEGKSIKRSNLNQDSDTYSDWLSNQSPDPQCECSGTASPQIHLDKTLLSFSLSVGNHNDSGIFTISNSGTGTLDWAVSENHDWISVSPTSGQDTGTVTVTVNSSGLEKGSYTGEIIVSAVNATNSPQTVTVILTVTGSGSGDAILQVDRDNLYFGSKGSIVTGAQRLMITNAGEGDMNWSISNSSSQLSISPASGSNTGIISVTVDPTGLSTGVHYKTIEITSPEAGNSPRIVYVFISVYHQASVPFGDFATPLEGAVLSSSIPVTGWVLDDIDVSNVKIYSNNNYVGDAVFVDGARPDVEQTYPGFPKNYQAGWGYMMLSNFLPGGGNGRYTISARATDAEGNVVTLGEKIITIDNAHAVKPFGALDTPKQGGIASGSNFINWGWVLTPQPNVIPVDGSTINVYVDGENLGHPVYNIYKSDIASLLPGYANSGGAGGYFYIDTTAYLDGLHTISWTATDSAGNNDGIGSRYFSIINTSASNSAGRGIRFSRDISGIPQDFSPILVKQGVNDKDYRPMEMNGTGKCIIDIKELERVELCITDYLFKTNDPDQSFDGYLLVGNQLKSLPVGSTLDRTRGIFYWMPGPGFYGEYQFVFTAETPGGRIKKYVTIKITPGKDAD
jgi:hypothetical protein